MGSCPDTDIDPFFLSVFLFMYHKAYLEDKLP